MFASADRIALPGDFNLADDNGHPVYLASATDPVVTVNCTAYCGVASANINIPVSARPATGSDHHMGIIEPDGSEYDFYGSTSTGTSPTATTAFYRTSILGSGQMPGGGATSGAALAAGVIRFDELARGIIPHALFVSANCVTGTVVYPGGSQGKVCTSGTGPPVGARIQLTLTDAQINALSLLPWEQTILHALHDYGAYVMDTNGDGIALGFQFEPTTQFAAFSQSYPIYGYPNIIPNIAGFDSAIDWAHDLRIVSPCYAQETCTQ
jgi:hypothetical protein